MSIRKAKWERSLVHAWIMWSQPASPLYDPEKALRVWDRSEEKIIGGLAQMGLSGMLPEDADVEITTNIEGE